MSKIKYGFICAVLMCAICFIVSQGKDKYVQWREDNCGIPDAVSSMAMNTDHRLTVVANSKEIEDKEGFARMIIRMCIENEFHSIKISTDINGYPSSLDIAVYLKRSDIGEKEPVCRIRYIPTDYNEGYDIKNNADQYHLYLDEREIVF